MKDVNKIKEAYSEILNVCEKYTEQNYLADFDFEDVRKMWKRAKNHLMIIDWQEKYGLNIKHDRELYGYNYMRIDDHRLFSQFNDAKAERIAGSGRYISWEDDGKQPKNEWLFSISFSTGAYIFGDDYPKDLFQEFWQELKGYNPKYCDSKNHSMYFSLETAKDIFYNFPEILKKYREKNKEDFKERKIKKLRKELEVLEA